MNINELKQEDILGPKVTLVEMKKLFGGLKVFIALPSQAGIPPHVLQQKYDEQMDMLIERATQPTPREMMDMGIAGLPALIEKALTKEN